MRTASTFCKTCRIPITVKIDDDCPECWEKSLLPLATCNRCADFLRMKRKIEDGIAAQCIFLCRIRLQPTMKDKELRIADVRTQITNLTKGYSDVVCRYYRLVDAIWESDFVDQLMEQPGKHEKILRIYRGLIYGHAKKMKRAA